MNELFVPTIQQTYDISIDLSGDKVTLVGLDQIEIQRFMSLMPKMIVTRYDRNKGVPNWIMSLHQEKTDGNS